MSIVRTKSKDMDASERFAAAVETFLQTGATQFEAQKIVTLVARKLRGAKDVTDTGASVSPSARPAGQPSRESLSMAAGRAREPSVRQRRAAVDVRRTLVTVLDTFKIRGRVVGDIRMGELETIRVTSAVEAFILRQIQRRAVADPTTPVRDVITPEEFQRIQQKATEAADVA